MKATSESQRVPRPDNEHTSSSLFFLATLRDAQEGSSKRCGAGRIKRGGFWWVVIAYQLAFVRASFSFALLVDISLAFGACWHCREGERSGSGTGTGLNAFASDTDPAHMRTGSICSSRLDCRCQPRRFLLRALLCALALAAMPLLVVLYEGCCVAGEAAMACTLWSFKAAGGEHASGRPHEQLFSEKVLERQQGRTWPSKCWRSRVEDAFHHCPVSDEKASAMRNAEPLIVEEPLKPWITLKKNIQNVVYLPTLQDLTRYTRHVYVDIGARNYGSSIGSWFKKVYPKQGQAFQIFAIEADRKFRRGYAGHSDVHFLPYAAWTRNETLFFGTEKDERGGMGRIQSNIREVGKRTISSSQGENYIRVKGLDIADWLHQSVSRDDFLVVKMDVEGAEFDLLPKLFDTGTICLIDELFLECHYNRWQRCCPERTTKFNKTYQDCLALFQALRRNGVLVHQWW